MRYQEGSYMIFAAVITTNYNFIFPGLPYKYITALDRVYIRGKKQIYQASGGFINRMKI